MLQDMDNNIIDVVKKINELGYETVWSCSGTSEDHPGQDSAMLDSRIAILCSNMSNKQIENLRNTAAQCGLFIEIMHNSIDGFLIKVYIPIIGNDGVCDLHRELYEKRLCAQTYKVFYETMTNEEIKEKHGGVVIISDERKMNIWYDFVSKLEPIIGRQ